MTTITVRPNMSMLDVVLQACGSMEAAGQFGRDNDVCLTDIPVPGTVYVVSDAALAKGDANVRKKVEDKGVLFGTLGLPEPETPLLNDDGTPLLNDNGTTLLNDNTI